MRPVLALAFLVLATACGADRPTGEGRLVVDKSLAGGPVFMEGSLTEVAVRDGDGELILEATQSTPGNGPVLERRLPAGDYRLTARERPCQGNCNLLDAPAGACEVELEIRRDRTTRVHVLLSGSFGGSTDDCTVG